MSALLKRLIKQTAYRLAPRQAAEWDERLWLRKKALELVRRAAGCRTPAECIAALRATWAFLPVQRWSELERFLEVVAELRPKRVCEIGAADGGTLFLLAQLAAPNAVIVSIDVKYSRAKRQVFPTFARAGQSVVCVEGDSHAPSTRDELAGHLGGRPIDLLFIDGDHSYEGVRQDFETYSPLVAPGGIIALHDIVPDFKTRFGKPTPRYSGGVPLFWNELRDRAGDCSEFVEHEDQDAYGIGILRWRGARA